MNVSKWIGTKDFLSPLESSSSEFGGCLVQRLFRGTSLSGFGIPGSGF